MKNAKCNTEHFKVNSKKLEEITGEEYSAWFSIYCKRTICNRNAHLQFADNLGITREEAKTLAQRIGYQASKGVSNLGYTV